MYNQMRRKTKNSQIDYFIGSVQIDNQLGHMIGSLKEG